MICEAMKFDGYPSVGEHSWLENPSHLDVSSTRNMHGVFPASYASLPEVFFIGWTTIPMACMGLVYLPTFTIKINQM